MIFSTIAVKGISDLIIVPGLINLDFADVRNIMSEMGLALMGTGIARGENRAVEAAQRAISSPLLEDNSIQGARGVLLNITGGADMTLFEINEASSLIQKEAHEDANIIFGTVIDENMEDEIRITVIATGFEESGKKTYPDQCLAVEQLQEGRPLNAGLYAERETGDADGRTSEHYPHGHDRRQRRQRFRGPDFFEKAGGLTERPA